MYTKDEVLQIMQQLKEDMGSRAMDMFLSKEGDTVQSVMQAIVKTTPSLAISREVLPIIGTNVYVEFKRDGKKSGISLKLSSEYLIIQGDESKKDAIRLKGEELQKIARDAFKAKQIVEVDGVWYVTFKVSLVN